MRRLLADRWHVVALSRPESQLPADLSSRVVSALYDGSLLSVREAFAATNVDVVVHLASAIVADHSPEHVDELLDANVRLPTHLIEAMRQGACKRMINTGTFWQHYNNDEYAPVNLYAATKQAFEDIAKAYVDNDGIRLCTLVLFDTYSNEDPRRKVVQLLIDSIAATQRLAMSPGEQCLDLTHADDVADAYSTVCYRMLRPDAERLTRYAVTGERLTLKELVALVGRAAGQTPNVDLGALPYRRREIMVPTSAIEALPGWRPSRSLGATLSEVLRDQRVLGRGAGAMT